jgi:parvulin-like peptidyl-prolyl isomerase
MKKKNMRNFRCGIAACLLALGALLSLSGCGDKADNTPVAEAGDVVITEGDLNAFTELMFSMYGFELSGLDDSEKNLYKTEALDTMVRVEALKQYYKDADVLADADIDANLEQFKDSIEQNGLADSLKEKGVTDAMLRYFLETSAYFQALQEEATKDGTLPTEADIEAYYAAHEQEYPEEEERRVSHILVGDANHSDEDRKLAEEIREKIASGSETFEDMAREYGSDGTRDTGGDLDYAARGAYVQAFDDVAFTLPQDVLSDIVETEFGFHVLKVTDIRSTRSLDTQRESIRSELAYALYEEKLQALIDDLGVSYLSDRYPAPEDRAASEEGAEGDADAAGDDAAEESAGAEGDAGAAEESAGADESAAP